MMVGTGLTNGVVETPSITGELRILSSPRPTVGQVRSTKGNAIDPLHDHSIGGTILKNQSTTAPEYAIRIGSDYQAEIPSRCLDDVDITTEHKAMIVWAPHPDLSDKRVEEYVLVAKERYGYTVEQALGMLFWHGYNFDKALTDIVNFEPLLDDWTLEDKVLFEQGFSFHGKTFHKIRQLLPDKPISSLVKYYYCWKRLRLRTSQIDKQARKLQDDAKKLNGHEMEVDDTAIEEAAPLVDGHKKGTMHCGPSTVPTTDEVQSSVPTDNGVADQVTGEKNVCSNCSVSSFFLSQSPASSIKGSLCYACLHHWRRTGDLRSVSYRERRRTHESQSCQRPYSHRGLKEPPRGMQLTKEDLHLLTCESPTRVHAVFRQLDSDVVSLRRQIQRNKQISSLDKSKLETFPEAQTEDLNSNPRINTRWTNEELLLAVQGVRHYGLDFKAIAEVIGNKTESHIKTFYSNYKRRYNLDSVLAEHEKVKSDKALENGEVDLTSDEDTLDKKETNGNNTSENKENLDSKTVCETIDSPLQHSNQTQSASNPVPSFDNTEHPVRDRNHSHPPLTVTPSSARPSPPISSAPLYHSTPVTLASVNLTSSISKDPHNNSIITNPSAILHPLPSNSAIPPPNVSFPTDLVKHGHATGSPHLGSHGSGSGTPQSPMPQLVSLNPHHGIQISGQPSRTASSGHPPINPSPPGTHHSIHHHPPPIAAGHTSHPPPSSVSHSIQLSSGHPHLTPLTSSSSLHHVSPLHQSTTLIRPHQPSHGPSFPQSPISALPLGGPHLVNRQIPNHQNRLVRPGVPALYSPHPTTHGATRGT